MIRVVRPEGRTVHLGLGSNVGDRVQNLKAALSKLATIGEIERVAGLYATDPVGVVDQPEFLNSACALLTDRPLSSLLHAVKQIEWEIGRRPGRVWGPRPIDIDILLASAETIASTELNVPHLRLAERGFVLAPLAEIAGAVEHPLLGQSIDLLLAVLPAEAKVGVRRMRGPAWALLEDGLPPGERDDAGADAGPGVTQNPDGLRESSNDPSELPPGHSPRHGAGG